MDRAREDHLPAVAAQIDMGSQLAHGAVSYTHLRAHETVLDLVCRLLLEKKKQKKTKSANSSYQNETN